MNYYIEGEFFCCQRGKKTDRYNILTDNAIFPHFEKRNISMAALRFDVGIMLLIVARPLYAICGAKYAIVTIVVALCLLLVPIGMVLVKWVGAQYEYKQLTNNQSK